MKCSECQREVRIVPHPGRNPNSRKGYGKAIKDHDLCRQCFRSLFAPLVAQQRGGR